MDYTKLPKAKRLKPLKRRMVLWHVTDKMFGQWVHNTRIRSNYRHYNYWRKYRNLEGRYAGTA